MKVRTKSLATGVGPYLLVVMVVPANASPTIQVKETSGFRLSNPISIIRSDKLFVDQQNRFCVTSFSDSATMRLVERSGESMTSWTVGAFANDTSTELQNALERAGLPTQVPRSASSNRVVVASPMQLPTACESKKDTIFVSIGVQSLSASGGYRVSLTAKQGRRLYIAQIDRRLLISMSMELRNGIPWDATSTYRGEPFWDVGHDIFKLRKSLVDHLTIFGPKRGATIMRDH